jgi:hypothetical protein
MRVIADIFFENSAMTHYSNGTLETESMNHDLKCPEYENCAYSCHAFSTKCLAGDLHADQQSGGG